MSYYKVLKNTFSVKINKLSSMVTPTIQHYVSVPVEPVAPPSVVQDEYEYDYYEIDFGYDDLSSSSDASEDSGWSSDYESSIESRPSTPPRRDVRAVASE